MRWAGLLLCCVFLMLAFAQTSAPLLAADIGQQREAYPGDDQYSGNAQAEEQEVAEYCYVQRQICRKICNLRSRFENTFDGCPQSCESRESRCARTGCYRWLEPELLIAENFGGSQCAL